MADCDAGAGSIVVAAAVGPLVGADTAAFNAYLICRACVEAPMECMQQQQQQQHD
jgi:hypothetical protein